MTDYEQLCWLRTLGPTRQRQIAALRELLRFAQIDEMSMADLVICRRQLARLAKEEAFEPEVRTW
jgi:hypothetical protein